MVWLVMALDERLEESKAIIAKYPNRVPVCLFLLFILNDTPVCFVLSSFFLYYYFFNGWNHAYVIENGDGAPNPVCCMHA